MAPFRSILARAFNMEEKKRACELVASSATGGPTVTASAGSQTAPAGSSSIATVDIPDVLPVASRAISSAADHDNATVPTAHQQSPSTAEVASRTDKYGLFPLHSEVKGVIPITEDTDAEEDTTYPIDIISVHGITGDAYDTWTDKNGTLWLRDFLPKDIPGARIFSYGYDAQVFFTLSTGGLEQYARTLLELLKQSRAKKVDISTTGSTLSIC
jgi:hypothetical protein